MTSELLRFIAELYTRIPLVLNTDEFDFADNPHNAQDIKDNTDKLELFENRRRGEETSLKPQQKDSSMLLLAQKTGDAIYTKLRSRFFER